MKRTMNLIRYLLAGILFLSYILILGTSKNPRVCAEYDLYYIKNELQDWPGYAGLQYEIGTTESFVLEHENRTKRRGNNWNSFEEDGCWTYGEKASVLFANMEKQNLVFEVSVVDVREHASASICIGGSSIGTIDTAKTYQFFIDKDLLGENITTIDFDINHYGAIGDDARNQGIKVKEITLYAANGK